MMEIIEKVYTGAKKLVPPEKGADEGHVRKWRAWMALCTFTNSIALVGHIALACGFFAPFYYGFAQSADLRQLKSDVDGRRVTELMGLMLDTKEKMCKATGEVSKIYTMTYTNLRNEYSLLMHKDFPDPPCTQFAPAPTQ